MARGQVNIVGEAKLRILIHSTFEALRNVRLGVVVKNRALCVEQCWLQSSVHLIHLISILLRCNTDRALSSLATSHVVLRGSALMIALSWP